MGKLIVIEGTDCSGKETQSKLLVDKINNNGGKAIYFSFPMYDSPTGKIIGGPFLGKEEISKTFFEEKAPNVNGMVSSLYFAADRLYNIDKIKEKLNEDYVVILDRYVESNMAHQGCKIKNADERIKMYKNLEMLEYNILGLPRPDKVFFLYMPFKHTLKLKQNRLSLDDNEKDENYIKNAESAYLELASMYGFDIVNCTIDDKILSIEEISQRLLLSYFDSINRQNK